MPNLLRSALNRTAGKSSFIHARGKAVSARRTGTPHAGPAINMPRPSIAKTAPASAGARLGFGAAMGGAAWGAMVGGVTGGIYNTDGGFSAGGAMSGAFGGAVLGAAAGVGLPAGARALAGNNKFMSTAGSYSSKMTQLSGALNTSAGRGALFGTGGMLGGFAMSSATSNNKRRGFNQNRGSRIN